MWGFAHPGPSPLGVSLGGRDLGFTRFSECSISHWGTGREPQEPLKKSNSESCGATGGFSRATILWQTRASSLSGCVPPGSFPGLL